MKTRGIIKNSLTYTGTVTLSQYIDSKKIKIAQTHNTGGSSLFNFLSNCLVGDFGIAKNTIPNKVMLLKKTDTDGQESYTSASGVFYLYTNPEKVYKEEDSSVAVRYSFMISSDFIVGVDFNGIGLYTADTSDVTPDPNRFAAFAYIDTSKINLSLSSALVVDWELYISN